jgi:hypothetical protein
MNYTLWSLIGDHPILSIILLIIFLMGMGDCIEKWRRK